MSSGISMNALVLRRASEDDAEFAYYVSERAMRDYVIATFGSWPESEVRKNTSTTASAGQSQVIELDSVRAGIVNVERLATHVQLHQLFILPEYQRHGIGTQLLRAILSDASLAGLPVRLRVLRCNPAKALYERHGFRVTSESPERFYMERAP
jgi:ribosomal protein S18 acetylase RimI-like enzyme